MAPGKSVTRRKIRMTYADPGADRLFQALGWVTPLPAERRKDSRVLVRSWLPSLLEYEQLTAQAARLSPGQVVAGVQRLLAPLLVSLDNWAARYPMGYRGAVHAALERALGDLQSVMDLPLPPHSRVSVEWRWWQAPQRRPELVVRCSKDLTLVATAYLMDGNAEYGLAVDVAAETLHRLRLPDVYGNNLPRKEKS